MSAPDLTVCIGAMTMKNPVMLASGVFGYGDEFKGLAAYGDLGALVLKTVTKEPRRGNPPASRTAETPSGMVNAIGLENVGLEAFLREKLPAALEYGTRVVASIAGDTPEDFAACERAGADAIALTNTLSAMVIDVESRRPLLAANTGGLSGPAIRPAAVYRVFEAARAVQVPVIGMGGIWNAQDALEFILAGATAVAVGTALYADPAAGNRVLVGIRDYLGRHEIACVTDRVGSVRLHD